MTDTDTWFSYSVFRFTREQMIWGIQNRAFFNKSKWPPEPSEYETDKFDRKSKEWIKVWVKSGSVDIIGLKQLKGDANFVNPKTIWADVKLRLDKTKTDGKLLIKEIESMEWPSYEDLEYPESRCALDYISLFDFRDRPPYSQWRKRRMYYEKTGR